MCTPFPLRLAALAAALSIVTACQRAPQSDDTTAAAPAATTQAAADSSDATTTAEQLNERMVQRRAVEAVVWGMPAVNFELMHDALVKAGGDWNQVAHWSRLQDWKNQTLTPNPDVIYLIAFYNTKDGPVVLEIPPAQGTSSITGSVDDGWQTAIEDVGPAGVDKGKGGKYLILPPGYKEKVPAGYIPMPSPTLTGMALLRSNIGTGSDADIAKAVAYGKQVKLHPLSQAGNPPPTKFVDVSDSPFEGVIPYDQRFFERLHSFVQREPWLERDRVMIDTLKSIGIEKGKPFAPDAGRQASMKDAAIEAQRWLDARYDTAFAPYYEGRQWALPVSPDVMEGMGTNFARTDSYPVSDRGMTFSYAFFSAKHLGQGQFYRMATRDKDGKPLDGGSQYRLHIPANAPVSLYWSATVYDRETHALLRDQTTVSRASTSQGLQTNPDGSVDVFFGPAAPTGKESNWVPTRAESRFELLFRFYGPKEPLFKKTWVLNDLEKM